VDRNKKKNSIEIIDEFLIAHKVYIDLYEDILKKIPSENISTQKIDNDIIDIIISDSYEVTRPYIKKISNYLFEVFGIHINSNQKNILKKYLLYGFDHDLKSLLDSIVNYNLKYSKKSDTLFKEKFTKTKFLKICEDIVNKQFIIDKKEAVKKFIYNLKESIHTNNDKRTKDYITFLYSRVVGLNELSEFSLLDLFNLNKEDLTKELSKKDFNLLKRQCNKEDRFDKRKAVNIYNQLYLNIMDNNTTKESKSSLIYIYLNQELFDRFMNEKSFFNYVLELIIKSYDQIVNHRTLSIHVSNILNNKGINLKWKLYSLISIFAEKFIPYKEERRYYHPAKVCLDILDFKFKDSHSLTLEKLNDYYKNSDDTKKFDVSNDVLEVINFCKNIYIGFSFLDCIVLNKSQDFDNSTELDFIENNNELLLIFTKNEIDDRKIPCPVCGSIKISGNSFPEIGIKSWECKNPLCHSRSKTNRGKRYSRKTIYMQSSNNDFSSQNIISKDILKLWRRDIVNISNDDDLYRMLIKYYTYSNDTIYLINAHKKIVFKIIAENEKRFVKTLKLKTELKIKNHYDHFYKKGEFIKQFISLKDHGKSKTRKIDENNRSIIYKGDALKVLDIFVKNSIENMVTSPPYYNAREYSQWKNLYSYLFDMFNIVKKSYEVLMPGGVFLYNIGDIFDNDRLIVHSNMGDRRIPLGAYTILMFEEAGFELLDNIIWDKGETQSNRHMNDGNFTPYYQRPANCYEHMFIFKKKGKKLYKNNLLNKMHSNIHRFSPVIKIGKKGVNRYGHTAPFPLDVPNISIDYFTNEGDTVLDPFLGSGTAIISAILKDRIGIGIELSSEYAELSKQKLNEYGLKLDIYTS
jgi:DNA modification methylase